MSIFGDIVLKFGATGEEGEEPLRFQSAHINLLVGPNNAGKSLMLRELSGVSPRANRLHTWSRLEYDAHRIVALVNWSEETARDLKQEIIERCRQDENPLWDELELQPWDRLVPALEQAVPRLMTLRDKLSATLLELVKANPDIEKSVAWISALQDIQGQKFDELVIPLAFLLLAATRATVRTSDQKQSVTTLPLNAERQAPALSEKQAEEVQRLLDSTWHQCQEVFVSLGVNTEDLVFDIEATLHAVCAKLVDDPVINTLLAQDRVSKVPPALSAEISPRTHRFIKLVDWVLDPRPLERAFRQLDESYSHVSWINPDQRAELAKKVLYLDGLARLQMTRSARLEAYDAERDDEPPILALLKKPKAMEKLRTLVADSLGAYLAIDIASAAPDVIWRLANKAPPAGLESSYSEQASEFHRDAALLDDRSDGIHAYAGMLAAILAKDTALVFIDEPEAFLYPPLVRKLARQLALMAREQDRQFFIATHSADLLASCASSGANVNIIRLTHNGGRSTARLLDSATLRELALDPLLRSESTLSALFHDGAIICEAAADRVLYQEINERLLRFGGKGEGLESCVFLNAQNWQTIPRMMAPLRKMGVAAAAVLDADVLFQSELGSVLDAAQVPKIQRKSWLQQRGDLRKKLAKRLMRNEKDVQLKDDVIKKLTRGEAKILKSLCTSMAEYGVFLVPVGELEDWFSGLGLKRSRDKSKWLRAALDRLGLDPEAEEYVRPGDDDIWQFMRKINQWILDPDREGTSPTPHLDD